MIDGFDAEAFAGALARLLDERELARSMGECGRVWAQTHFDLNTVVERFETAYRGLLGSFAC